MAYNLMNLRRRIIASQPHLLNKSGDLITFSTNLARPLSPLILSLSPVQSGSGDPYPPGGGKNKLNAVTANSLNYGGNYTNFTINDSTGVVTITNGTSMGFIVPVQPSGQYTFSYVKSVAEALNTRVREYSDLPESWTDNFIEQSVNVSNSSSGKVSETFTVGANTKYIICSVYHGSSATNLAVSEWQCESGSSATAYAPYSNERPITGHTSASVCQSGADTSEYETHTATIPTPPGTVYGCDIKWQPEKKIKVTHALVTYTGASSESWSYSTHPTSGIGRVSITLPDGALANTNDLLSNMLTASDTIKQYPDAWKTCIPSGSAIRIGVPDTITSADDWKTLLASNNLQIIYPLATPIEYSLSDLPEIETLLEVNNVWVVDGTIKELKAWGF